MIVSHFPYGPTVFFSLHSVALRHDLPNASSSTVSEQYPHLIFEAFSSKLGKHLTFSIHYPRSVHFACALSYLT
jgi:U3 small nucleolar ribonucleoprotein protein IMP4